MNKVEKIKAEIERLKESLPWGSCASQISMECNCKNEAYNEVLSYIDSLSDTEKDFGIKSSDLEEAAHSYVDTAIEWFDSEGNPCCYPAFIAGAQWQKERDQSTIELAEDHAYLAGQEKIIEKACEWLNNFYSEDRYCYLIKEDIDNFKKAMEE